MPKLPADHKPRSFEERVKDMSDDLLLMLLAMESTTDEEVSIIEAEQQQRISQHGENASNHNPVVDGLFLV